MIDINGLQMAARLDGPAGAPVVMFSNSLMCNYAMWDAQFTALSERYRVLRYDIRGQGRTAVPSGPYAIDDVVQDACGVMDHFGVAQVHFVGISFGGLIGQRLTVTHPDRVQSLVLCDTASHFAPESIWNERIDIARRTGMAGLVESVLKRWFSDAFIHSNPCTIETMRKMILSNCVDGFCNCCQLLRDTDLTDQLREISPPILVLHGADDLLAPLSRTVHARIKHSKAIEIADAGHLPNIDQPGAFNAALLTHLERHR